MSENRLRCSAAGQTVTARQIDHAVKAISNEQMQGDMRHEVLAQNHPGTASFGLSSTFVLALGTFAVGTDAYIVSAFLPEMAESLQVSTATAGQSVVSFTLAYAILSPILATLTSSLPRRRLLVASTLLLGLANLGSAFAASLGALIATRIIAAGAAASYTPSAGAVATALVRPEMKARALAIVIGGLTVATAIGVPLGHFASTLLSWRASLVAVTVISFVAAIGILRSMPILPGNPTISLKKRLSVLRRPGVIVVLPLTVLGMAACYAPHAFMIQVLHVFGVSDVQATFILACYGVGAVVGNFASGAASDRWTPRTVLLTVYSLMITALGSITWLAFANQHQWLALLGLLVFGWGVSSWAQGPVQQARLVALAPSEAPLVIALNASAIYFGFAIGSTIGSLTLGLSVSAMLSTATVLSVFALAFAALTTRDRAKA
jgi:MFS transporter, DHA1 family, inner membrane transport protein